MKVLLLAIFLATHPVHVTLTGIDYDGVNRIYTVFVKMYSDDMTTDMKLAQTDRPASVGDQKLMFGSYLNDRIKIIEDSHELKMNLVDIQEDGAEHRFRLEAKGRRSPTSVTVINRIMTRLYDDQANMLLFSSGGSEEGYKFTVSDTLKTFSIK